MDTAREESNVNVEQTLTSSSTQNMSGSGRKRGHQHHVRHAGTRSSNIKADEIIAALRRGDQLPIAQTIHPYCEQTDIDLTDDLTDVNLPYTSTLTTDQNGNQNTGSTNNGNKTNTLIDDFNKNNRLDRAPKPASILTDSTNERMNKINVISRDSGDLTESTVHTEAIGALNSDIEMETILKDELNDSISSGSSSGSKTKSKRSKKGATGTVEPGAKKERRSKKTKSLLPRTEERPPLEGADADQWLEHDGTADVENDPEAAEWSKLRCTSERAEVVAEREYRRQNRRCADYPGLAFGRSIFSSDTMMKLNIIRNELHNIMKTQLKRVRVKTGVLNRAPKSQCTPHRCIQAFHIFIFSLFKFKLSIFIATNFFRPKLISFVFQSRPIRMFFFFWCN